MTTMCVRHIDTIVIVQLVSILTDTCTSPKLISKHVLHYDIQGLLRNMKIKKIDFCLWYVVYVFVTSTTEVMGNVVKLHANTYQHPSNGHSCNEGPTNLSFEV